MLKVQFYDQLKVVELSFEQQHLKYYQTSGNCFQADKTERKNMLTQLPICRIWKTF